MTSTLSFPPDFIWGAATSAYQIEGGRNEGGKGPSIWDTFSHLPGKTHAGATGDIAADHYHRWAEDVEIMARLNLGAYRFSIAWSRILPAGRGQINQAGLDFYDRLVDALLEKGITPVPTLFHYDLPQPLQDQGGWPRRETAEAFGEYAAVVARRLGDRAAYWITHNEPMVTAIVGHLTGEHAPGWRNPFAAFRAVHHLLLSHGYAVQALRANLSRPARIGIALNLSPVYPATDSAADRRAAHRFDGAINRLFLDPLLTGRYPPDVRRMFRLFFPRVRPDDLACITAPLDFVGLNYYSRRVVGAAWYVPFLRAWEKPPAEAEYSPMWEIYPPGLYDLTKRVWQDYRPPAIIITENGLPTDGRLNDTDRIRYLAQHLAQLQRAMAEGAPVRGYFVWSLLDNFEWALGYQMRFGLVHVDYETLARTIKASGRWYARLIQKNELDLTFDTDGIP